MYSNFAQSMFSILRLTDSNELPGTFQIVKNTTPVGEDGLTLGVVQSNQRIYFEASHFPRNLKLAIVMRLHEGDSFKFPLSQVCRMI